MRNIILILNLIISLNFFGQNNLKGSYENEDEFTFIKFLNSNKFELFLPSGPDCGVLSKYNGTYSIDYNKLRLKLDYNYPNYEQDLKKQNFKFYQFEKTTNDSITMNIKVIDVSDNYPVPETEITLNGKIYMTDYDGNISIKASKNKQYRLEAKFLDCPKIDTLFTPSKNFKIQIGLMTYLMDLSKDYYFVYEIIKFTNDELIIQNENQGSKKIKLFRTDKK